MTEFQNKSFSVGMAGDEEYRQNWERIFGKKEAPEPEAPEPKYYCRNCEGECFQSAVGYMGRCWHGHSHEWSETPFAHSDTKGTE